MPEHSVVRARINERIKEEAASVLSSMGLTISDAFRLLLVRIAREKALPFEPLVPNTKTIAAMRAARRGHVKPVGRIKDLSIYVQHDSPDSAIESNWLPAASGDFNTHRAPELATQTLVGLDVA